MLTRPNESGSTFSCAKGRKRASTTKMLSSQHGVRSAAILGSRSGAVAACSVVSLRGERRWSRVGEGLFSSSSEMASPLEVRLILAELSMTVSQSAAQGMLGHRVDSTTLPRNVGESCNACRAVSMLVRECTNGIIISAAALANRSATDAGGAVLGCVS